jgi:hypothetical protein
MAYPEFFRPLTEQDYKRLTPEERIVYLKRAIAALPDDALKAEILKGWKDE